MLKIMLVCPNSTLGTLVIWNVIKEHG
jgi:hypothetical protein